MAADSESAVQLFGIALAKCAEQLRRATITTTVQITFVGLLALVVGSVLCFGGLRFVRFLLLVVGFGVGFALGALGEALIARTDYLTNIYGWIAAIVLGLVLAGFAYAFYVAGVAVLGGAVGYAIGYGVMTALGYESGALLTQAVGIAAAALAVVLTFVLNVPRALVVLYTALSGAAIAVIGGLLLLGRVNLDKQQAVDAATFLRGQPIWLLVWLVLALAGIGAQWRTAPRKVKPAPTGAPAPAPTPAAAPSPAVGSEPPGPEAPQPGAEPVASPAGGAAGESPPPGPPPSPPPPGQPPPGLADPAPPPSGVSPEPSGPPPSGLPQPPPPHPTEPPRAG